jgi:hypothetical protein
MAKPAVAGPVKFFDRGENAQSKAASPNDDIERVGEEL